MTRLIRVIKLKISHEILIEGTSMKGPRHKNWEHFENNTVFLEPGRKVWRDYRWWQENSDCLQLSIGSTSAMGWEGIRTITRELDMVLITQRYITIPSKVPCWQSWFLPSFSVPTVNKLCDFINCTHTEQYLELHYGCWKWGYSLWQR